MQLPIKYPTDSNVYLNTDVTFPFSGQVLNFSSSFQYGNQLNESLPCNPLWSKLESEANLLLGRCEILFGLHV